MEKMNDGAKGRMPFSTKNYIMMLAGVVVVAAIVALFAAFKRRSDEQ